MKKIAVVGLGYVGLPLAVAFGEKQPVVGFDISRQRVDALRQGIDRTEALLKKNWKKCRSIIQLTPKSSTSVILLLLCSYHQGAKQPDLSLLISASETVGKFLRSGSIVVYESTVYPGVTEEECVPVLEKYSGMKAGKDFFVGYSPERINR